MRIYDGLDFTRTIEEMSPQELATRIETSMNIELDYKIIPIPYLGVEEEVIVYEYPELIGRCPATGYPDIYTVRVIFEPLYLIPELKSLKFYYLNYFNMPISHEHLAARIFRDFNTIVVPKRLRLELDVAVRGGVYTTVIVGDSSLEGKKHKDLIKEEKL